MMTLAEKPLRQIAAEFSTALQVFQRFDLDLRRMGDQSLAEACSALSLSAEQVEEKLTGLASENGPAGDPSSLSLTQLIQRIVRVHHRRVRQELPLLAETAKSLERNHFGRKPQLAPLARLVGELHREMFAHIGREEQLLFPCIALLEQENRINYPDDESSFRALRTPVTRMLADHAAADGIIEELRQRTNHFRAAVDACEAKLSLFAGLRTFDEDLAEHLRLENEFLFPRALDLETSLLAERH